MKIDKAALVTGSGKRRVGAVVAEALAARGFALAIHYRTSQSEAEDAVSRFQKQGVDAFAVRADLTEESSVRALVSATVERFGRLDVLVNCAATWNRKRLEDVTAADLRADFDTNALGTFLCAQAAGLAMVDQETGGCIVNVGDWATRRPYLDHAAYFVSKGTIPTLTRVLAVELASRNPAIRVNCVMPGPVMLPPEMPETDKRRAIAATLVKREGRPENIAQAVLFLIDNDFVTGVCLPVDGGRSVFAPDSFP